MSVQHEDDPRTFLTGVAAIDTDGHDLFLMDIGDPKIIQVTQEGQYVGRIGNRGKGPGELGAYAPKAFAVNGPSIWIIEASGALANYYENGKFITSFKPKLYTRKGLGMPSGRFAFDQEHIILPAYPFKAQLAHVYDYGGELKRPLGKALDGMQAYLETNPMLNHTLWETDGTHWYAIFIYRPIIRKYNQDFEKIAEFFLTGPEINEFEAAFSKNEKDPQWTYPKPHFTDLFWFDEHLYTLSNGALYQIDDTSGSLVSRSLFSGEGELSLENYGRNLIFHFVAILDSGQVVLANYGSFANTDFWRLKSVPFL